MKKLMETEGVNLIRGDQCQYGAEVGFGKVEGRPVKKPTGFLSNSPAILEALSRRCVGVGGSCSRRKAGVHAHCEGRVCREAARYSRQLCQAFLRGMHRQMQLDGVLQPGCIGAVAAEDDLSEGRRTMVRTGVQPGVCGEAKRVHL